MVPPVTATIAQPTPSTSHGSHPQPWDALTAPMRVPHSFAGTPTVTSTVTTGTAAADANQSIASNTIASGTDGTRAIPIAATAVSRKVPTRSPRRRPGWSASCPTTSAPGRRRPPQPRPARRGRRRHHPARRRPAGRAQRPRRTRRTSVLSRAAIEPVSRTIAWPVFSRTYRGPGWRSGDALPGYAWWRDLVPAVGWAETIEGGPICS